MTSGASEHLMVREGRARVDGCLRDDRLRRGKHLEGSRRRSLEGFVVEICRVFLMRWNGDLKVRLEGVDSGRRNRRVAIWK